MLTTYISICDLLVEWCLADASQHWPINSCSCNYKHRQKFVLGNRMLFPVGFKMVERDNWDYSPIVGCYWCCVFAISSWLYVNFNLNVNLLWISNQSQWGKLGVLKAWLPDSRVNLHRLDVGIPDYWSGSWFCDFFWVLVVVLVNDDKQFSGQQLRNDFNCNAVLYRDSWAVRGLSVLRHWALDHCHNTQ